MARKKINLFEEASRLKIRFQSPNGVLSVEDLWVLPLTSKTGQTNLDDLAKALNRQVSAAAEESFVERPAPANIALTISFEIVKYVIGWRLEQNEAKKAAEERQRRKARIRDIIADKQDEELSSKSLEELEAELEAL